MTKTDLKCAWVVVSAWAPELSRLRALLSTRPEAPVVLQTVGVGLVEAAIGASRILAAHRPERAIFLGTCGRYENARHPVQVLDVVVGSKVSVVDGDVVRGASELPPPMPASADLDARLADAFAKSGAIPVHIANTIGITVDATTAGELGWRFDVEHLEAFAFARACHALAIPCAVVLGVANDVGPKGREQWKENHVEASARAGDLVARALDTILRMSTKAQ